MKDGDKLWSKIATVQVIRFNGYREEILCQMNLDLSAFIGTNLGRQRCLLSGGVHYLDFEVTATHATNEKIPNPCCEKYRIHWHPDNLIRKHYKNDDEGAIQEAHQSVMSSKKVEYISKLDEPSN